MTTSKSSGLLPVVNQTTLGASEKLGYVALQQIFVFGNPPSFLWNYGGQGRCSAIPVRQSHAKADRSVSTTPPKTKGYATLGATATWADSGVGSELTAHGGDARSLPPWIRPK